MQSFVDLLQRTLALVVDGGRGVLAIVRKSSRIGTEYVITIPRTSPLRLAGGDNFLEVSLSVRFVPVEERTSGFELQITEYQYIVLNSLRQEILAYHFHPAGMGWCTYPHLHVKSASSVFAGKAHLITGPVLLPAVVRMLIEDPAIPVVPLRPDWPRVLDVAQRELERAYSRQ